MVLDWIMQFLGKMLAREGKRLDRHRFSPGFGDLPLTFKKEHLDCASTKTVNLALTRKIYTGAGKISSGIAV